MFNAIFFEPLYNALVFISTALPGHDIGWSIVILTIVVKSLLQPFYHQARTTQGKVKELEPKIKALKEKHATDKSEQAKQIMLLYKEHGVNPFASFLVLFIQLPIVIALFAVFRRGFNFDKTLLYSFVTPPASVQGIFLGLIDLSSKSWILAGLAGLSQYIQISLAVPPLPKASAGEKSSFGQDFARSMNVQTRYVMPLFIIFLAHGLAAAVSVYWITGNLFAIGHELYIRAKAKRILTV